MGASDPACNPGTSRPDTQCHHRISAGQLSWSNVGLLARICERQLELEGRGRRGLRGTDFGCYSQVQGSGKKESGSLGKKESDTGQRGRRVVSGWFLVPQGGT